MEDTPKKILDSLHGRLKISDEFIISKKTAPGEIFMHYKTSEIKVWDVKNGFIHYSLMDVELQGKYFYFSLCFFGDQLDRVTFGFKNQAGLLSWDDWSEEKERQVKVEYDNWLNNELGKRRAFPWGEIGAFFDAKGGSSGIVLKYS